MLQPVPCHRITRTVLGSLPFICSPKPSRDRFRFLAGARCGVANSCRECMYISPAWNISHQSKTGPHKKTHCVRRLLSCSFIWSAVLLCVKWINQTITFNLEHPTLFAPLRASWSHSISNIQQCSHLSRASWSPYNPIQFAPLQSFAITVPNLESQYCSHLTRASRLLIYN